jgi:hypothetical protein
MSRHFGRAFQRSKIQELIGSLYINSDHITKNMIKGISYLKKSGDLGSAIWISFE